MLNEVAQYSIRKQKCKPAYSRVYSQVWEVTLVYIKDGGESQWKFTEGEFDGGWLELYQSAIAIIICAPPTRPPTPI